MSPSSPTERFYKSTDKQWAEYAQSSYDLGRITGITGLSVNGGDPAPYRLADFR